MFVFGLSVSPLEGAAAARRVRMMMSARGPAPDGVAMADAPHAAAGVARWAVSARDLGAAPHWDGERQLLVAGDVRLYNRAELLLELRDEVREPDPSDLELARLSYLRWGRLACSHLMGDFAFAVWDERQRILYAARDHLGVRPLYYRVTTDGVLLATDIRQILCLVPNISSLVDDRKIFDRFTRRQRTHGRTFFRGISLLRPGHYGLFDERGLREVRYWNPPDADERLSYGEHCERVRATFERAVRDRLEADGPIIAHSSGGFDSSSILMAAEHVYAENSGRPPLVMASALTPGMPCDESHLMDAVGRHVRFEAHRWSALDPDIGDIDDPILVRPGQRRGMGGGPRGDILLARERGARVLLTGDFGDVATYAWGLRRDMARRARWRMLFQQTVGRHPLAYGGRLLLKAGLGLLPPRAALHLADRTFGLSKPPPIWMGPRLRELYPPGTEDLDMPEPEWPSHLACEMWARVTSPHSSACLDFAIQYGANDGIEVRVPYADVRLVECILRIPAGQRLERGGGWSLRKDAFGLWLPPEFERRTPQPAWTSVFAHSARHAFPRIRELFQEGTWLSARYVEKTEAAKWLEDLTRQGESASMDESLYLLEFGALEAWLRLLLRYDTGREVVE
jgi:asparagine synthase (glutamine-hydrolysing)